MKPTSAEDVRKLSEEARKLLGLDLHAKEMKVVYGAIAADDRELAMLTRSMIEIMVELASQIELECDVPQISNRSLLHSTAATGIRHLPAIS